MDSSLSLSSWYRGIHCYALYQSWWQTKNSCHFPFFQAVKSGNNGLGSAIESSGSQLIEVVSWSMICFPSQLFEGLGDGLTLTLDILKRKVYNTAPLVKSPRLLSWPELVWKNSMEMENNRFEREWVSTQRSRVRRLTGREEGVWSPLVRVWISFFPRHIPPSLFCGLPYKQGIILHSLITTYQSGGYSFVDDFEVRNSRLTVCSDRRPFAQLHICTCQQLSPLIFAGGKCKAFQVVNISSVYNNVSSSLPLSKFLPLSKLLPLPSSTAWFTDFLTWYQSDSHTATGGISSVYIWKASALAFSTECCRDWNCQIKWAFSASNVHALGGERPRCVCDSGWLVSHS